MEGNSADRHWQTKVLDTWKVPQLNWPRQNSVETWYSSGYAAFPIGVTGPDMEQVGPVSVYPGVGKIASWICDFYLRVAARTIA